MTKTVKKSNSTTTKKSAEKKPLIGPNDKVSVSIAWSEIEKPYRQALAKLAKDLKIEGFRQGKAPLDVVEKKVDQGKVIELTLHGILPQKYIEALKTAKKQPITAPEYHLVSIEKGKDWVIEADFCEIPKIELGDYKKLVAAGKKAAAKFIKERNTDLAKKATEDETAKKAADKKEKPAEKLSPDQEKEIYYQHILRDLTAGIRPTIGELLLRRETQAEFDRLKQQLESYKMTVEAYLAQRQTNMEALSNELASSVLSRLQIDFILAEIAKDKKLQVDEKAVTAELAQIKDEALRTQIEKNEEYLASIKAQLLRRQTIESLLTDK